MIKKSYRVMFLLSLVFLVLLNLGFSNNKSLNLDSYNINIIKNIEKLDSDPSLHKLINDKKETSIIFSLENIYFKDTYFSFEIANESSNTVNNTFQLCSNTTQNKYCNHDNSIEILLPDKRLIEKEKTEKFFLTITVYNQAVEGKYALSLVARNDLGNVYETAYFSLNIGELYFDFLPEPMSDDNTNLIYFVMIMGTIFLVLIVFILLMVSKK